MLRLTNLSLLRNSECSPLSTLWRRTEPWDLCRYSSSVVKHLQKGFGWSGFIRMETHSYTTHRFKLYVLVSSVWIPFPGCPAVNRFTVSIWYIIYHLYSSCLCPFSFTYLLLLQCGDNATVIHYTSCRLHSKSSFTVFCSVLLWTVNNRTFHARAPCTCTCMVLELREWISNQDRAADDNKASSGTCLLSPCPHVPPPPWDLIIKLSHLRSTSCCSPLVSVSCWTRPPGWRTSGCFLPAPLEGAWGEREQTSQSSQIITVTLWSSS